MINYLELSKSLAEFRKTSHQNAQNIDDQHEIDLIN